jgi:hypothetical protein
MDQFLGLVLALFAFAFLIFLIGRAVKFVILLGLALVAFFVLTALGILG